MHEIFRSKQWMHARIDIFFDFWNFKDEREKHKNDPKYENFGSNTECMQEHYECQDEHQEHFEDHDEHQEHIFEKFLMQRKHARHQT